MLGLHLRVILVGKLLDCSMQDVEDLLRSYKLNDAIVRISGEVRLDDVEDAIFETTTYKPAVIVANKLDLKGARSESAPSKTVCEREVAYCCHVL